MLKYIHFIRLNGFYMSKMLIKLVGLAVCLPVISGCNMPREQLIEFNRRYEAADFNTAAVFAQTKIKKGQNPAGEDLLWTLQAASARRNYTTI